MAVASSEKGGLTVTLWKASVQLTEKLCPSRPLIGWLSILTEACGLMCYLSIRGSMQ